MILNTRYIFILSYLFLLFGYYIGEDLNGNASEDYIGQYPIILEFNYNSINSFLNYDNLEQGNSRQSPIFFFILSLFNKVGFNENSIRFVNLNLCFLSVIIFYYCLKKKYPKVQNYFIVLLSVLIIFSPSFRSLSIWPNSINLGLIFFLLSIYFFLGFLELKKISYATLNIIFLSIASYISPNYSVFSIFYFYIFFKYYKQDLRLVYIIFLNLFLSIPAFYYIIYLDQFFFFQNVVNPEVKNEISINNIVNKISIISTIIFFHIIPFLNKSFLINPKKNYIFEFIILSSFIYLIITYFNYPFFISGGGIFFKISHYFFNNNLLFYLFFSLSFYVLIKLTKNNLNNFILILCLIISNPQFSIYHKYFDPLVLILFVTLFDIRKFKILINSYLLKKLYLFYLIFILLNITKLYLY